MQNENVKVLGKIEAERPCDCCGTKLLKVAVVIDADGAILHYGRECAGRLLFGTKTRGNGRRAEIAADVADHAREATRRNKLARVAAEPGRANLRYAVTGRPLPGSYFARRGDEVVRVDGSDSVDVEFYASEGFEKLSK